MILLLLELTKDLIVSPLALSFKPFAMHCGNHRFSKRIFINVVHSSTQERPLQLLMKKTSSTVLWTSFLLGPRQHPQHCAGVCCIWPSTQKSKVSVQCVPLTRVSDAPGTQDSMAAWKDREWSHKVLPMEYGHMLQVYSQDCNWFRQYKCCSEFLPSVIPESRGSSEVH